MLASVGSLGVGAFHKPGAALPLGRAHGRPKVVARALRAELPPPQAPRLLDQVRERIRYRHYSHRTEKA